MWTGDGRPDANTAKFSKGVDVFVTEIVPDTMNVRQLKFGMPAIIGTSTIDMCHTPHYAIKQIEPRLAMVTHLQYDETLVPEMIAGIRTHWDGLFQFSAPDVVVVNVTKQAIWTRRAALPDDANFCRPSKQAAIELFDLSLTNMSVNFPNPRNKLTDLEGPVPRNVEYDPRLYYPPDVYRQPEPSFPKDFKIDIRKMIGEKIEAAVQAKIEEVKERAEETVEALRAKINALQKRLKDQT